MARSKHNSKYDQQVVTVIDWPKYDVNDRQAVTKREEGPDESRLSAQQPGKSQNAARPERRLLSQLLQLNFLAPQVAQPVLPAR